MLDFDFKLKDKKLGQVTEVHRLGLVRHIVKLINKYFNLEEYITLSKNIIVGITSSKTNNNFHLLIPGLFLTRASKQFLIDKIIMDGILDRVFEDLDFKSPECPLDTNCKHVPVFFVGNTRFSQPSKQIKPPYILIEAYKVFISRSGKVEAVSDIYRDDSHNLSLEFSLNFESPSIKKMLVSCKEEYKQDIADIENKIGRSVNDIEDLEKINTSLSILRVVDPEVDYIYALLDILALWRSQAYWPWYQITQILASMGKEYKPLSMHFNMKCSEKFVRDDYETTWEKCLTDNFYLTRDRAMAMLIFLVKHDNPDEFAKIREKNVVGYIYSLIYNITVEGLLEHDHVARILHKLCKHKFIIDRPEGAKKYVWYEFMLEGDKLKKGELYKWRELDDSPGIGPSSLELYITTQLADLAEKILRDIKDKRLKIPSGADDDVKKRYINHNASIINGWKKTCRRLRQDGFIRCTMNRCRTHFDTPGFSQDMNQNPMVFGVGNGVLELHKNGKVKFIDYYHSHKISKFTKVNYKPFNPQDPMTKYLLTKIRSMFLDDSPDSFNWFMHWMGSALDGNRKAQILLILWGLGNNGKSMVMDLFNHVFGKDYCCPLPTELLTRITTGAENATPILMTIDGKHVVIFSETETKQMLNMQMVKRLLGGENVMGRKLHRDPRQFGPICVYVMLCNNKPDIPTPEEATWKRIKLLHLPIRFYPKGHRYYDKTNPFVREADKKLKTIKDDPEAKEAFLSIVVHFWQSLQFNYGGNLDDVPCPHIIKDTEMYRNEQDTISAFINLRVVNTDPKSTKNNRTYLDDIIKRYCEWFESTYHTGNKLHTRDLAQSFRNSKLGKHLIKSRQGEYTKGMRFLRPLAKRKANESYKFDVSFEAANNDEESEGEGSDDDMQQEVKERSNDEKSDDEKENPREKVIKKERLTNELLKQLQDIKKETILETLEKITINYERLERFLEKCDEQHANPEDIIRRKSEREITMQNNAKAYKIHIQMRMQEKLQRTKKTKELSKRFSHVSTKYYDSSNSESENGESDDASDNESLNVSEDDSDDMIDYMNN